MKKVLCLALMVALAFTFVACGAASAAGAVGYTGESYTLKIGTYFSGKQVGGEYAQEFSDKVAELSDGKIKIDVYQDMQLGSQSELTEALQLGTVDFAPNDFSMYDTVYGYKKGAIFGLPFVFASYENVWAFYQSEEFTQMKQELLDQYEVRTLSSATDGFRKLYAQVPVNNIDDMKKLKLRVPDISSYVDTFQALGCNTVIVPGAELYTSLQNGIVNSLERPADGMYSNNLWEQTKYVINTNHMLVDLHLFVSEKIFSKLDPAAQAVIIQAGNDIGEYHFKYCQERDKKALDALVNDCNQQLIEFDTTQMKQICKEKVWTKYLKDIDGGQKIIDKIESLAK
ncbi:MAG: TRAP transporter substrate-binding protein [Synergistaceae bacterium]|nr:TRAP transporter substrate-binding protein [Synergistaceae bacterium]